MMPIFAFVPGSISPPVCVNVKNFIAKLNLQIHPELYSPRTTSFVRLGFCLNPTRDFTPSIGSIIFTDYGNHDLSHQRFITQR